jgi:hypothetical protein
MSPYRTSDDELLHALEGRAKTLLDPDDPAPHPMNVSLCVGPACRPVTPTKAGATGHPAAALASERSARYGRKLPLCVPQSGHAQSLPRDAKAMGALAPGGARDSS